MPAIRRSTIMNLSQKKWRLLDKIVAVCVLGILVGAAFGIISAHPGNAGASDDPNEGQAPSGDPFEPPEDFESAVVVDGEDREEPLYLRRYDLQHIDPDTLMPLISGLGIDVRTVRVDANRRTIWARGTGKSLWQLGELITAVDRAENKLSIGYASIVTEHITPSRMIAHLSEVGLSPDRYITVGRTLMIFDRALLDRWSEVVDLASRVDTPASRDSRVFIYTLRNTAGEDAAERLNTIGFSDVQTQTFNYPELSKEIMVICPPEVYDEVVEALATIDTIRRRVRVPLITVSGDNARRQLEARRTLLSQLSGVPEGSMHISDNISGNINSPEYVLWVEESPEVVKQLEALLNRL